MDPSALLHDVFDGDAGGRDEFAELGDAPGAVADRDLELHEALLGRQPALQAAAQDRRVDVAARQDTDHPGTYTQQHLVGYEAFFKELVYAPAEIVYCVYKHFDSIAIQISVPCGN